jgi:hypothetical protein
MLLHSLSWTIITRTHNKMRSNDKITVTVDYPIDKGVLGFRDLEVTRVITIKNLFAEINKHIDINHTNDVYITHMRRDSIHKLYSQHDWGNVYLYADSKLSLVCPNRTFLVDSF